MKLKLLKVCILFIVYLFVTSTSALNPVKNSNYFIDLEVGEPALLKDSLEGLNINTFHLFTHGRSGELLINGTWMNAIQIENFLQK